MKRSVVKSLPCFHRQREAWQSMTRMHGGCFYSNLGLQHAAHSSGGAYLLIHQ